MGFPVMKERDLICPGRASRLTRLSFRENLLARAGQAMLQARDFGPARYDLAFLALLPGAVFIMDEGAGNVVDHVAAFTLFQFFHKLLKRGFWSVSDKPLD